MDLADRLHRCSCGFRISLISFPNILNIFVLYNQWVSYFTDTNVCALRIFSIVNIFKCSERSIISNWIFQHMYELLKNAHKISYPAFLIILRQAEYLILWKVSFLWEIFHFPVIFTLAVLIDVHLNFLNATAPNSCTIKTVPPNSFHYFCCYKTCEFFVAGRGILLLLCLCLTSSYSYANLL